MKKSPVKKTATATGKVATKKPTTPAAKSQGSLEWRLSSTGYIAVRGETAVAYVRPIAGGCWRVTPLGEGRKPLTVDSLAEARATVEKEFT